MSDKRYCYPDTNVLINKFGVMDDEVLKQIESAITSAKIANMIKSPIKGDFSFKHLQAIHKNLFNEIYPFAGQVREVAIAKSQLFCLPQYIHNAANDIFGKLQKDNFLRGLDKESFIKKLAFYSGEINALHPFREGNGRTLRLFIKELATAAGYKLNIEELNKDALLAADIAAMNGQYGQLIELYNSCAQENNEPSRVKPSILARIDESKRNKKSVTPHEVGQVSKAINKKASNSKEERT